MYAVRSSKQRSRLIQARIITTYTLHVRTPAPCMRAYINFNDIFTINLHIVRCHVRTNRALFHRVQVLTWSVTCHHNQNDMRW